MDPYYSYCNLTTEFAIEVYGEPLRPALILAILAGVVGVVLVLLVATYIYYRRKHIKQD